MALSLQVIYPITEGTHFDMDYYIETHIPMVGAVMGAHIQQTLVTKGVAGGPDTPPGFYAVATLTFTDKDAMNAAMAVAGPVMDDIANFTDISPSVLIGEVIS